MAQDVTLLSQHFDSDAALNDQVASLMHHAGLKVSDSETAPFSQGEDSVDQAPADGGMGQALLRCHQLDVVAYAHRRNHLTGAVSKLSAYIRHGLVSESTVADFAKSIHPEQATRFIQQLAWRSFFLHRQIAYPETLWKDVAPYKTGWQPHDYAQTLPEDIKQGTTGVLMIDQIIQRLLTTGYLHNRERLYLAAYIVHWRRVAWQAGARWFLVHLLDGEIASNNFSWQWVASTSSQKPYIFNLENVRQFHDGLFEVDHPSHAIFAGSYQALATQLFPHQR